MSGRGRSIACAALAVAWAAGIFWASSRPNPFPFAPPLLLSSDKLGHALAYAVLAALVVGALVRGAAPLRRSVVVAVVLAAAYGATDEWHQSYVPNRDADPADLVADAVGAAVGAAVAGVVLRGRKARASIAADVGDPRI